MKILLQVLDAEFLVFTRKLQTWVLLIAQHPQLEYQFLNFRDFLNLVCNYKNHHLHLWMWPAQWLLLMGISVEHCQRSKQPLLPADTESSPVLFTSAAGSLFWLGTHWASSTALAFFSFLCHEEAILTTKRTTNSVVGRPGRLKSKSNVSSHVAGPCLASCLQHH